MVKLIVYSVVVVSSSVLFGRWVVMLIDSSGMCGVLVG